MTLTNDILRIAPRDKAHIAGNFMAWRWAMCPLWGTKSPAVLQHLPFRQCSVVGHLERAPMDVLRDLPRDISGVAWQPSYS
eukprot:CAMPEP_0170607856 /NCGR_PEP_ID=MMETSP0224-20130122/21274_1 /TAXON_ID=285029 /ORGANISM="Togula jolla, Strain CCCM 725" /LENGTH=80 /DNA_ID=CAMNT_0010933043 /DNA_START=283 /DNA_END=525 /DNA_ORIENTATION=-